MRIFFYYEKQKFLSWIRCSQDYSKSHKSDNFLITQEFPIWKINILEILILSLKDNYPKGLVI